MRTSFQPLAHLVDAAAEKWLAVAHASDGEQLLVSNEITRAFRIGDNAELTFHGLRYLLGITRVDNMRSGRTNEFRIEVHEIAFND